MFEILYLGFALVCCGSEYVLDGTHFDFEGLSKTSAPYYEAFYTDDKYFWNFRSNVPSSVDTSCYDNQYLAVVVMGSFYCTGIAEFNTEVATLLPNNTGVKFVCLILAFYFYEFISFK